MIRWLCFDRFAVLRSCLAAACFLSSVKRSLLRPPNCEEEAAAKRGFVYRITEGPKLFKALLQ